MVRDELRARYLQTRPLLPTQNIWIRTEPSYWPVTSIGSREDQLSAPRCGMWRPQVSLLILEGRRPWITNIRRLPQSRCLDL
ncbi:hypothetical protein GDO81_029472 [Engystomops pustulosus]|uniref:Uncharacterized protein n=1 Tax=Engystomops pustulosus TaxID=76066 RepID=A0AAV6YM67_ENGPU|nr:hypothetical protein GDO81_029472 [Engystomops pustulosus]